MITRWFAHVNGEFMMGATVRISGAQESLMDAIRQENGRGRGYIPTIRDMRSVRALKRKGLIVLRMDGRATHHGYWLTEERAMSDNPLLRYLLASHLYSKEEIAAALAEIECEAQRAERDPDSIAAAPPQDDEI